MMSGAALSREERMRARAYARYLRENAARYGPDARARRVALVRVAGRVGTRLYHYELRGEGWCRRLVVKVFSPAGRDASGTDPGRGKSPLAVVEPRPSGRASLEFAALRNLQDHFERLNDERFHTLRVHELVDGEGVLMDELTEPTLRDLVLRRRWMPLRRLDATLVEAAGNTGAWLRALHAMSTAHSAPARRWNSGPHALEYAARQVAAVVSDKTAAVIKEVVSTLLDELPGASPPGPVHGDFAPRNLAVGPGGSIAAFDTITRAPAPVYEDIGFFLNALAHSWPDLLLPYGSGRLPEWLMRDLRWSFLTGYFGDAPVPVEAVALFESVALLHRWARVAEAARAKRRALTTRMRLRAMSRAFAQELPRLLAVGSEHHHRSSAPRVGSMPDGASLTSSALIREGSR